MLGLALLHRDAHLAVFAKPSGLLVHRGWGNDREVALDLARRALDAYVYPVHRIDRATSGVLLFALDAGAAAALGKLFAEGLVEKTYVALVRGVAPDSGDIEQPVPKTEGGARVPAATSFRRLHSVSMDPLPIEADAAGPPPVPRPLRFSLVEARPHTGRLHQIRRHLKHIGHPIVGDVNYGKGDINRIARDRFGLHRLALHAARLAFDHPVTGARLSFAAPIPDDLLLPLLGMGFPLHPSGDGSFLAGPTNSLSP